MSRMRYIGRWGLMRSVQPENVSEHSHMVAVLAHALAGSLPVQAADAPLNKKPEAPRAVGLAANLRQ